MVKDQITADLKQAMLAGDTQRVTVLRGLKTVIQYAEVAAGKREEGLPDQEVITLLQKESKKRQDSADLYANAGEQARSEAELSEKVIIDGYLPKQLSEAEVALVVDEVIAELGAADVKQLGQVIAGVRAKTAGSADGAIIARLVKAALTNQ